MINNYRPRIVVWRLTHSEKNLSDKKLLLSQKECILIIDNILRISKPIIIFAGSNLSLRPDLFDIVGYANALGLKVIVEIHPKELSEEMMKVYRIYGPRVFRIIIDDCIVEDIETRFKNTKNYTCLNNVINLLKKYDYELHLSCNILQPDLRKLALNLDFAFRSDANGLYCHLKFDDNSQELLSSSGEKMSIDTFIMSISEMKTLLPNNMYFSPHCVCYLQFSKKEKSELDNTRGEESKWIHYCMGGRTFVFISEDGKLYICSSKCQDVGDLRKNDYDFVKVWTKSKILKCLREIERSCSQTIMFLRKTNVENKYEKKENQIATFN